MISYNYMNKIIEGQKAIEEAKKPTYYVIACNKCHREGKGITLRKGKDSYYCTQCYYEMIRKGEWK